MTVRINHYQSCGNNTPGCVILDWGFIKPNFRLYVISCDNDFKVISVFSGIKVLTTLMQYVMI